MPAPIDELRRAAIVREVDALADQLIGIRRDLHQHPEIGHAEHRTTAVVVGTLEQAGLVAKVLPIGTGAYCDVPAERVRLQRRSGSDCGPTSMRCRSRRTPAWTTPRSTPASPTRAGTTCTPPSCWVSALVLARLREANLLSRGVRLIFQPAEETSPGGALDAIDGGVLQDLTEVYALHCDPRTDVGQIALKPGPITSAVDQVDITLSGTGGHTSRPHLTQDIVGALGALATTAQLVLSRRVDPRSGVSLIVGLGACGLGWPTPSQHRPHRRHLRALDVSGWQQAKQLLPQLAAEIVKPFGVTVEVSVTDGVPPAVNHPEGVNRLTRAAHELVGPGAVTLTEQSLGGEDFSWMLQQVPGALARLGVRTPGQACPDIHQSTFVVDEACIPVGLKVLAEVATTRW